MIARSPKPSSPERSRRRRFSITEDIARTKIRLTSQRTKYIANIVIWLDAVAELSIPTADNPLHDVNTSSIDIRHRYLETAVISGQQTFRSTLTRILPVEIRDGAHDDHTGKIEQARYTPTHEDFESAVIFLLG